MKKLLIPLIIWLTACSPEPDIDKIITEAFEPYPNMITVTSRSEADAETQINKLMALYEKEKYDEALKGIDSYLQSNPAEYDLMFYRGIIHLKKGNGSQAVDDFKTVVDNNEQFREQAEWYLGLAYLKNNQKKEAADLLFRIAEEDHEYADKAYTILNKIPYKKYMSKEIESM